MCWALRHFLFSVFALLLCSRSGHSHWDSKFKLTSDYLPVPYSSLPRFLLGMAVA